MSMMALLVVIVGLVLVGVLPVWPYSRDWGYVPSVIVLGALLGIVGLLSIAKV